MNRTEGLIMSSASRVAALLAAIFFLIATLAFWPFVADDAYIVGRYALNVAAGHGLVYNAGEYVSALTSPLHALIEAAFAVTGLPPVTSYRVVSVTLPLVAAVIVWRSRILTQDQFACFMILGIGSPFVALWTIGGLETPLLLLLATMFAVHVVSVSRSTSASGSDLLALGILAGLLFVTRFDTVLVTAPILLAILTVEWRRRELWIATLAMLLPVAGWLSFSQAYYGEALPTSFYVKMFVFQRPPIDSIATIANFMVLSGIALAIPLLRLHAFAGRPLLARRIAVGTTVAIAVFGFYATRSAGQHMMFGFRMFVPWLPAFVLILALQIQKPRVRHLGLMLVFQSTIFALVWFGGMNPAPLNKLPGLDRAYAEYRGVTPKQYGVFMAMLEQDATDIRAHWDNHDADGRPSIYLRTGGTGYWLPDFEVRETLVSYRHACGVPTQHLVASSHYVQRLGFSLALPETVALVKKRSDIDPDNALISYTEIEWMGIMSTGYYFGSDPGSYGLGARLDAGCNIDGTGPVHRDGNDQLIISDPIRTDSALDNG